jgi:cytidylate kinase|tara:strand:+ start:10460 stop:11008 length:549 start_codon:yes stop_codon:yes gene_type:complete
VSLGYKIINTDDAYEYLAKKSNIDLTDPDALASTDGQATRQRAKALTDIKQQSFLDGRLGVVIDGTGKDYDKIEHLSGELRKIGYDCAMVFVNTDLDTALERNAKRDRRLPNELVTKMWKSVQTNIGKFHNFFGRNMFVVDNSNNESLKGVLLSMYRRMKAYTETPHTNPVAKAWIKTQQGK